MQLNKSFITNLAALSFIAASYMLTSLHELLLFTGLFALSGALTNQLAIHMLFEKVPLLYGSGVIPAKFESFKESIKNLMMQQFFTQERLDAFFQKEEKKIDLVPIINKTDFSPAFDALSKTVMESSFGGMLGMFGGASVIESLRQPFTTKMQHAMSEIVVSESFNKTLQEHLGSSSLTSDMLLSIEEIIDARLAELTPKMVKEIIQEIIKEHLGWLVVWGGVFGGAIGAVSSKLI